MKMKPNKIEPCFSRERRYVQIFLAAAVNSHSYIITLFSYCLLGMGRAEYSKSRYLHYNIHFNLFQHIRDMLHR